MNVVTLAIRKNAAQTQTDLNTHTEPSAAGQASTTVESPVDEIRVMESEFDRDYYLTRYPDVANAGVDPLLHFCNYGWAEGRDPSPRFSTPWYTYSNPDVNQCCQNSLLHYIVHGKAEGRLPLPPVEIYGHVENFSTFYSGIKKRFNAEFYIEQNPDVVAAGVEPLVHFLTVGWREFRDPTSYFRSSKYVERKMQDEALASINPFYHFIQSLEAVIDYRSKSLI